MSRRSLRPPSSTATPKVTTRTSTSRISTTTTRRVPSARPSTSVRPELTAASGAIRRPSGKPSATKVTDKPKKEPAEFQLPAFSTMTGPKKQGETELEKLKKKNLRRVVAEGEDPKMIKEILRAMRDQDVLVQEFVAKIGPVTGDNGDCLRKVMADELASFRKLALKVYETMTQDVNDVLMNEHAQLMEYYKEKIDYYTNKMTRCIDEIYELCPNFDFEKYYSDKGNEYLESLFPIPEELEVDPEELEAQKRQEMYHRLQWLRAEGERLTEENKSLQRRLAELKRLQKGEQNAAAAAVQEAEQKRQQLQEAEAQMEQRLEELNESMEKEIYQHEKVKTAESRAKVATSKKTAMPKKRPPKRPEWNVETAVEIEGTATKEAAEAVSKVSTSVSKASTRKSKFKRPPPQKRDTSPFHYSPVKTPPQGGQDKKETSPFHYSPPKTPPAGTTETKRHESSTVVTEETPSAAATRGPPRMGRRGTAPRDSWGGY